MGLWDGPRAPSSVTAACAVCRGAALEGVSFLGAEGGESVVAVPVLARGGELGGVSGELQGVHSLAASPK